MFRFAATIFVSAGFQACCTLAPINRIEKREGDVYRTLVLSALIKMRPAWHYHPSEAPRPQGGASRKGNLIHIVPLNPAYPALGDGARCGQKPFLLYHTDDPKIASPDALERHLQFFLPFRGVSNIFSHPDRANTSSLFRAILLFTRHERFDHLKGETQRPFHHSQ